VLEFALAGTAGLLALIPAGLTWTAWRRTGSRRIFFAMLAFLGFVIRGIILGILYQMGASEIYHEITEFGGDIVIISLFVVAFLSPGRMTLLSLEEE